jgi:hypothetical protein
MDGESQGPKLLVPDFCACAKRLSRASFQRFGPNAERGADQREIWKVAMSSTSTKTPSLFDRFWALSGKMKLLLLLIVPIALLYAGALLLSLFNFSVGERAGVLSKLSTKGVACWTMEGELAQPSFSKSTALRSGGAPIDNTFYFSVPDPDVRKQVEAVPPGSPVSLQYEQKLFALDLPLPFLCRRRTQFEITGVRLAPALQPEGFPARPVEPK